VNGLFVTGTDTGVGKTAVGAGLLRLAWRRGLRAIPFKPVETGCEPEPQDAQLLREAAGRPVPLSDVCPHPLALPAAPAIAATAAGVRLDIGGLVQHAARLAAHGDLLLVEGAGGLLVPYADGVTAADFAAQLGLPILVVARTSLGTINHTALTIGELSRRGLPVAGVVLVRVDDRGGPHEETNAAAIAAVAKVIPLGTLPHLPPAQATDPDALADALERALGPATVRRLLGGG
jgi:dethiobiotin synthetase